MAEHFTTGFDKSQPFMDNLQWMFPYITSRVLIIQMFELKEVEMGEDQKITGWAEHSHFKLVDLLKSHNHNVPSCLEYLTS